MHSLFDAITLGDRDEPENRQNSKIPRYSSGNLATHKSNQMIHIIAPDKSAKTSNQLMTALEIPLSRVAYITILMLWAVQLLGCQPSSAQTVSPSPRTRTLSAPGEDYFQQITKGHPYRWFDNDMAVRVLIKPGEDVPNFRHAFDALLRQSFMEWAANSNSKIKFQFVTEEPADITCQFVADLPKKKAEVAGVTSYQTSPHHMDSAVISIKTKSDLVPLTDDLIHGLCLHEIGHALGLVSHSLDPHDVMYPYLTTQRALTTRDVNTIHRLYEYKPPPDVILQSTRRQPNNKVFPFGLSSDAYEAYTREVVVKLRTKFSRFPASPSIKCNVRCLVDSVGNIFNYRIFEGSNNDAFDQIVLNDLLSALPLPPAPIKLTQNQWSKVPIAIQFRSDGEVIPFVEPSLRQSDWLQTIEEPSPDEMMKDLEREKTPTPKIIDPNLEPWIVTISEKAHGAWKDEGTGKTEVIIGIRKNGRVAHLVMVQSSGSEAFDNSVLNACVAAEPYPAAPNSTQDTTEVNLLFEHQHN
jgi:TonB family protein